MTILCGLLVAAPVLWLVSRREGGRRATGLLLAGLMTCLFVVIVVTREVGDAMLAAASLDGHAGSRYAVIPALLFLSLVALAVDQPPPSPRARRLLAGLGVLWLLAVVVPGFSVQNQRSAGPTWSGQVRQAVESCRAQERQGLATLSGPPDIEGAFQMRIACFELPP